MRLRGLSGWTVRAGSRALAWGLAIALATPAEATTTSWTVEYARGDLASVGTHRNLTLEVVGRSIRVVRKYNTLQTIPGDALVTVVYDVASYRPAAGYLTNGPSAPSGGSGGMAAAGAGLFFVVIPLLLAPIVKKQHFLTLMWKDGDVVRDMTLQVKDKDREHIRAAFGAVSGAVWRDAPAERDRLEKELKEAKSRSFVFDLDREVSVADTYIDAGSHRAVVLDRVEGAELIVFKRDSYKLEEAFLTTPVRVQTLEPQDVSPSSDEQRADSRVRGAGEAVVVYRGTPEVSTIGELRVVNRVLTLPDFVPAAPGLPRPVAGMDGRAVEIAYGQFAVGTIQRAEFEGEPAFRFRGHRMMVTFSPRDLYVSRDRIIFAPQAGDATRKQLVLQRSEILGVSPGDERTSPDFMRLATRDRKYGFWLHVTGRDDSTTSVANDRRRLVVSRLVDFIRLAIVDFDGAVALYDGWLAGVPDLAPSTADAER